MSDQTALLVYWDGNLRIAHCDDCCSRWYFTFNGTECSSPAAIDGTIYMVFGKGSRHKNLHRPRHIEGVCEKNSQGHGARGILGQSVLWLPGCCGCTHWMEFSVPHLHRRNTSPTGMRTESNFFFSLGVTLASHGAVSFTREM